MSPKGQPPKILFVTHELSRTGAPLILRELVAAIAASRRYELITFAAKGGPLLRDFRQYGHVIEGFQQEELEDLIADLRQSTIIAFCNTANVNRYAEFFSKYSIQVVTLIHEIAHRYSAEYFKSIYDHSDKIVFPSEFAAKVANEKTPLPKAKAIVLPQGLLGPVPNLSSREQCRQRIRRELSIPPDAFVVLGCGTVDMRKGVDSFLTVAQTILRATRAETRPVHFVWLGSSKDPDYAYWIKNDVETGGLTERVHMIGQRDYAQPYYLASDLFILTSREDPFPCVVLEAMACALPVVAFEGSGGAPEALDQGAGVIVKYRDLEGMAQKILRLLRNRGEARRIGEIARQRVAEKYDFGNYVRSLARTVREDLGVPLKIEELPPKNGMRPRVLFFNRDWWISGANALTEILIKGLIDRGIDAELVFPQLSEKDLPHLPDVPLRFLHLDNLALPIQWKKLIEFAEANAPYILVPNYDYLTSAITPVLSNQVGVIGIVHSNDVEHYDHVNRLGRYWNRIVCVADYMTDKVEDINPSFVKRIQVIRNGIEIPEKWPARTLGRPGPIRLIYTGRLVQHQKRVQDLAKITRELAARRVPYRLTVVGEGGESKRLEEDWAQEIADGTVVMSGRLSKHEIVQTLRNSDVFLLVSDFEGLPISLLEGMAQGVVPIVTDQPCGIPDLVTEGVTGFRLPVGDVKAFATQIANLAADRKLLLRMSKMAHAHVLAGFRDELMVQSYEKLIRDVWDEILRGEYKRPESIVYGAPLEGVSPPNFLLRDSVS